MENVNETWCAADNENHYVTYSVCAQEVLDSSSD